MALSFIITNVTATRVDLQFAGYAGGSTIDAQFAINPDFEFCVAPLVNIPAAVSKSYEQLNHATTYYIRAREVTAGGVAQAWAPVQAVRTVQSATWETGPAAVMIEPALAVVPLTVLEWIGSNSRAGYPVANLGYDAPVAWESAHPAACNIIARMAPEPIDTIALLMTNLPESATWAVSAATTQAGLAAPAFSAATRPFRASLNVPGRPGYHGVMRLDAPQAYAWWRIDVSAACPGGVIHVEHAIFGKNRVTKNHSIDMTVTPQDGGSFSRNRFGIPDRQRGFRSRRVDFEISAMTELQYETAYRDLDWRVGQTDPVLVVPNSKSGAYLHDRFLYGPLVGTKNSNPTSSRWTKTFSINSMLP